MCQTKDEHSRQPCIIVEMDPTKYFLKTCERCDAEQTGVTILFIVCFWKVDINNLPVFKN